MQLNSCTLDGMVNPNWTPLKSRHLSGWWYCDSFHLSSSWYAPFSCSNSWKGALLVVCQMFGLNHRCRRGLWPYVSWLEAKLCAAWAFTLPASSILLRDRPQKGWSWDRETRHQMRNGKEPEAQGSRTWTWLAGSWRRRCWSLSRNVSTVSKKLCKQISCAITALEWASVADWLLLLSRLSGDLLHLCTWKVCLPFVWETSHNLSRKRMRRCWLSDAHFHLDDLNTILTWKSGQGFTLQIP